MLLDELGVGLVDCVHAFSQRLAHIESGAVVVHELDVGEPLGLARLANRVDVHGGRLADVLDGLRVGFGGVGFGHVGAVRQDNNTMVLYIAMG